MNSNQKSYVSLYVISSLGSVSALHLAVMQGRLNNVRVLLTESNIDAEAYNVRYTSMKNTHQLYSFN